MTARDHRELMYVRSLARKIDRVLAALECCLTEAGRSDSMNALRAGEQGMERMSLRAEDWPEAEQIPLSAYEE